jgi:hypothetical protein
MSNRLGYGLDGPEFESRHGQEFFLVSKMLKPALPLTRPLVKLASGLERPVLGVVHSPPSSAEVANERSNISAPSIPSWREQGRFYLYLKGLNRENCVIRILFRNINRTSFVFRVNAVVNVL